MSDGIGGFIGAEGGLGGHGLPAGVAFSTGRAGLGAVLDATRPRRVHLPDYTCDAVLEPIRERALPVSWYAVGRDLRPVALPSPDADELLVLTDLFGVQGALVAAAAAALGERLVVDATQAFFGPPVAGAWAFTSARKFFGVADGAFVTGPGLVATPTAARRCKAEHLRLRAAGESGSLVAFRAHEQALDAALLGPCQQSLDAIDRLDRAAMAARRRANYAALDAALGELNALRLPLGPTDVPLAYPLLPVAPVDHAQLHARRIWAPRYWPWLTGPDAPPEIGPDARHLARWLLPLPVDQRYGPAEMARVASVVWELVEEGLRG